MSEAIAQKEAAIQAPVGTEEFVFTQTMLRVRDPAVSVPFYRDILGMSLLKQIDFPDMKFSIYMMGYLRKAQGPLPDTPVERAEFAFSQKACLELTHNWGSEQDKDFTGYHDGNSEPRGFGHIGISVPDVDAACNRFESLGVEFIKKPDDGQMKGLAFIKDPDGYWIEILKPGSCAQFAK